MFDWFLASIIGMNTYCSRDFSLLLLLKLVVCVSLVLASLVDLTWAEDNGAILKPHERVRVDYDSTITDRVLLVIPIQHSESKHVIGQLESVTADSIVISSGWPKGKSRRISTSAIKRLFVSEGSKRGTLNGLLIGSGTGAVLTFFMLGAPTQRDDDGLGDYLRDERDPAKIAAIMVGGGAVLGGIIGWFVKEDRCREVEKSDWPIAFGLDPRDQRLWLRITQAF